MRLDDLKFPDCGLPFFDDRRSRTLLKIGAEARELWWQAAKQKPDRWYSRDRNRGFYQKAWASLRRCVPEIATYRDELWAKEELTNGHIAAVIFRLLSIVRTAHEGKQCNLATRENTLVAMLNTALHSSEYARYGKLIRSLIILTAAKKLLTAESLWKKINTACATVPQIEEDHPMWKAARWLFPEALDSLIRHELESLGSLPEWATSA